MDNELHVLYTKYIYDSSGSLLKSPIRSTKAGPHAYLLIDQTEFSQDALLSVVEADLLEEYARSCDPFGIVMHKRKAHAISVGKLFQILCVVSEIIFIIENDQQFRIFESRMKLAQLFKIHKFILLKNTHEDVCINEIVIWSIIVALVFFI